MTKRLIIVLLGLGLVFGGIFGFKAFMNAQMTKYFANMQPPPVAVTQRTMSPFLICTREGLP